MADIFQAVSERYEFDICSIDLRVTLPWFSTRCCMKNLRPNARLQITKKGLIAMSLESKSITFHESLDKLLRNPLYRITFVYFHMIDPSLMQMHSECVV